MIKHKHPNRTNTLFGSLNTSMLNSNLLVVSDLLVLTTNNINSQTITLSYFVLIIRQIARTTDV